MQDDPANLRQAERQRVLKSVRIAIGMSVTECLLLDQSATGLRVSGSGAVPFPLHVRIELGNGQIWSAERRWQRDDELGFQLVALLGVNQSHASQAADARGQLHALPVEGLLAELKANQHFHLPDVEAAAQAFEAALHRLDAALATAATPASLTLDAASQ